MWRSDGGEGSVRHGDHDRHIGSDSEDAGVIESHLSGNEERGDRRRQDSSKSREEEEAGIGKIAADKGFILPDEVPVRPESDRFEGEEIDHIDCSGEGIIEAKGDDHTVHRKEPEGIEEIDRQKSDAHDQFAYRTRHDDIHEDIAGRFADGLIEHEESEGEYEIIVLDEEWRFISEPCSQGDAACPIDKCEDEESDKRNSECPEEEAVVGVGG